MTHPKALPSPELAEEAELLEGREQAQVLFPLLECAEVVAAAIQEVSNPPNRHCEEVFGV